jgi:polysaccharide deacetylase family protein (PEP-CTERM system associated)
MFMLADTSDVSPASDGGHRAVMSVDVEDWFHVENLRPMIRRGTWSEQRLRVEQNTDRMLALMAGMQDSVRCTFFVLGWVAERCPELVRRIVAAGHEVASHGYGHELLGSLSPEAFRADAERAKGTLEDIAGTEVRGYRAPSFSITDWAIPILQELGYSYDSSFFPSVGHDRYGKLTLVGPDDPVVEVSPGFFEISISCLTIASRGLPWGGGGYFRLMPYELFRLGAKRILQSGRPYVFYIHPWEIDPGQPRVYGLPAAYRWRHYVGLNRCEARFRSLLADFPWMTMAELVRLSSGTARGDSGYD